MFKLFVSVCFSLSFLLFGCGLLNKGELLDGFEMGNMWQIENWQNVGESRMALSAEGATEGKSALKIQVLNEMTDWKDKVALSRIGDVSLTGKNISMDITNNASCPIQVAMGFDVAPNAVYFESNKTELAKGLNKGLLFNLSRVDFKSEATNWEYKSELPAKDVKKMFIIIYRPTNAGEQTLFIDNIRLIKG